MSIQNNNNTLKRLALVTLVSLLLAACGGGGGDTGGDTGGTTPTPAPTDKTPDPITFTAPEALLPGTLATSAEATISGLDESVQASISSGGEISVNGGAWTADPVTVKNGDTVRVRATAGNAADASIDVTLTVGEGSATFSIPTAPAGTLADTRSASFELPAPATIEPGATITSEPVIVSGINTGTSASVSGIEGAVLIVDGVVIDSSEPVTVYPGQTIQVSLPAPAASNGVTEAIVTIGGVSNVITLITPPTEGETDSVPEPFAADVPVQGDIDPDAAEPGQSIIFGPLTVNGISGNVPVQLDGPGGYSLDGGGSWSDESVAQKTGDTITTNKLADTVTDGSQILVRLAASDLPDTRLEARLNVGGVSKIFAVTTRPQVAGSDSEPDAFSFAPKTGVATGSNVVSNAVTITGIDVPADITIEGGSYRINGSQFTATGGVIANGQRIELRVAASAEPETATTTTVTIGGISADFSVTTAAEDNQPPVANAGADQSISEGGNVTLNGSASSDPEQQPLTFAWTQTAGPAVALNGKTTTNPSFTTPAVDTDTALTFELTVTDSAGLTAKDSVTVTVTNLAPGNTAPTANAGADQTVNEGATVTLSGSGSDAEDDVSDLTFQWTAPAGITLSSNTVAKPTFTAPDVTSNTTLTFTLTVTDSEGAKVSDSVRITVAFVNQPPVAQDDSATVEEDGLIAIDVLGNDADPDGDSLTVASLAIADHPEHGSASVTGLIAGRQISYQPDPDYHGSDSFTYLLSDGHGGTDTATVHITVTSVNDAPSADAGEDRTVPEGPFSLVGSGTDPDGDEVSFKWTQTLGPTVSFSNSTSPFSTVFPPDLTEDEIFEFSLEVTDGNGGVANDTVRFMVTHTPFEPTVTLSFPIDGARTTANQITVRGMVDDGEGGGVSQVFVNGEVAVLTEGGKSWSRQIEIDGGDNTVFVSVEGTSGDVASNVLSFSVRSEGRIHQPVALEFDEVEREYFIVNDARNDRTQDKPSPIEVMSYSPATGLLTVISNVSQSPVEWGKLISFAAAKPAGKVYMLLETPDAADKNLIEVDIESGDQVELAFDVAGSAYGLDTRQILGLAYDTIRNQLLIHHETATAGDFRIVAMDTVTHTISPIFSIAFPAPVLEFVPSGDKIVLSRDAGGSNSVYTLDMNAPGNPPVEIDLGTTDAGTSIGPIKDISASTDSIVYIAARQGGGIDDQVVYEIDLDSGTKQVIYGKTLGSGPWLRDITGLEVDRASSSISVSHSGLFEFRDRDGFVSGQQIGSTQREALVGGLYFEEDPPFYRATGAIYHPATDDVFFVSNGGTQEEVGIRRRTGDSRHDLIQAANTSVGNIFVDRDTAGLLYFRDGANSSSAFASTVFSLDLATFDRQVVNDALPLTYVSTTFDDVDDTLFVLEAYLDSDKYIREGALTGGDFTTSTGPFAELKRLVSPRYVRATDDIAFIGGDVTYNKVFAFDRTDQALALVWDVSADLKGLTGLTLDAADPDGNLGFYIWEDSVGELYWYDSSSGAVTKILAAGPSKGPVLGLTHTFPSTFGTEISGLSQGPSKEVLLASSNLLGAVVLIDARTGERVVIAE